MSCHCRNLERQCRTEHHHRSLLAVNFVLGHDVATLALDHLGDHVVNQTVLVPDAGLLKVGLVLLVVDLLEDVLESSVVLLQNGVLCAHVQRQLLVNGELETGVCETRNTLVSVVLGLSDTTDVVLLEVEDLNLLGLTALGGEDHLEGTLALDDMVLGAVLVTESVTTNDDGLLPAGYETGNARDNDGLTEDGSTESVSDGAVGRQPHWNCQTCAVFASSLKQLLTLLQVELLDTGLVRGDGSALDTDRVLLDSLGGINGDLVVGLISVGKTEIVVLEVDVEVRVNELVLDVLPDDASHLITIKLDNRVLHLDLVECSHPSSLFNCSKSGSRNELRSYGSVGVLEKATGSSRTERGAHGR
ncbi:putative isocitrate dehydrogenase, partial [Aureobasidium melanogenum]